MRILVMCFGDKLHGFGHVYRCQGLISTAVKMGHDARMLGNYNADYTMMNVRDINNLLVTLYEFKPDWLVIDLEEKAPEWMANHARNYGAKVAYLNGVGRTEENYGANLVWIQDSPKTVILRDSVLNTKHYDNGSDSRWFVFGGSADPLNLLPTFARNVEERSWLICTELSSPRHPFSYNTTVHKYTLVQDITILAYMAKASKMCTHMGMINWEGAYLGLPIYTFSRGEGHLGFAKGMETLGLVRAYPEVGIPAREQFLDFVYSPFRPDGERPDGKGAERFLETIGEMC